MAMKHPSSQQAKQTFLPESVNNPKVCHYSIHLCICNSPVSSLNKTPLSSAKDNISKHLRWLSEKHSITITFTIALIYI